MISCEKCENPEMLDKLLPPFLEEGVHYSGILILFLVTSSWVGATQFLKVTYHNE